MTDIERLLGLAQRAARVGGAITRVRLGNPGYLQWKANHNVTCGAALEVQEAIAGLLLAEDPQAAVLAEEGPDDAPIAVDAEHLWIVDPICGSLNYVQGIPYFGVSVALRVAGLIQVGVVYDPCANELFAASTETPATLNGASISVQHTSEGLEAWSGATVATDWPYGERQRAPAKKIVAKLVDQVRHCPVMGSPALGLCYVAAGRLQAYWHLDLRIWDVAAASVILQRAGATLSDAQGGSWLHSDGSYLASNVMLHEWTVTCLQSVLSERP